MGVGVRISCEDIGARSIWLSHVLRGAVLLRGQRIGYWLHGSGHWLVHVQHYAWLTM
jgi:hypothetical protein